MNLHEEIAQEITLNGAMPFSRFMELALYHPSLGFYASGGAGRRKDFITSPETGPLFGKLVANALDKWWKELGNPDPFYFIEAGAGPGTLARSVLKAQPDCQRALRYIAVEKSALQRSQHPEGVQSSDQLPDKNVSGVIFANELLDNLPFDIYESEQAGEWSQVCVGSSNGLFHEVLIKADEDLNDVFGIAQSSGTRIPYQTMARRWLSDALGLIESGRVVVIDYALPSFPAAVNHKWLRTYRGHGPGESPLVEPGSQDITTDVDLNQISSVRTPDSIQFQHEWLQSLGISDLVEEGKRVWFENASNPNVEALAARSRAAEAEALLDLNGLGGFTVIEWKIQP